MSDFDAVRLAQGNAHAILFYGSPGSPARERALAVARVWLCAQPVDGMPCGACQPCRNMTEERAIDFHRVEPGGLSAWIKLEQILPVKPPSDTYPISSFIETGPIQSPRKVVLIERCERLLGTSSNALLKMIEEPHPRVRFVLTSESIGQVVPTILSRCLCVACPLPESLDDASAMEELFAEGSQVVLERIRANADAYAKLHGLLESLSLRRPVEALKAADEFREIAEEFREKEWGGKRAIHCELVRCLGLWVRSQTRLHGAGVRQAVELHRRVLGNGNFGLQTDWFFCEIFRILRTEELQLPRSQ